MSRVTPDANLRLWAAVLGLGGLIPFVGHVALMLLTDWISVERLAHSQFIYGVTILTFIGALHWGVALADPAGVEDRLGLLMLVSVVPALYAWLVAWLPLQQGLWMIAAGLMGMLAFDFYAYRKRVDLDWFIRLRIVLTVVGVLSLVIAAVTLADALAK
jgi:hypothetical protein